MTAAKHVAVIMDGNGRWAQQRLMPRIEGHRRGISALRTLVETARRLSIPNLSVFAFSSENWKRPADEVAGLMRFFVAGLKKEAVPLRDAGVRMHVVGDRSVFSADLNAAIDEAESIGASVNDMHFNICLNYGGRWDIVQAAQALQKEGEAITIDSIEKRLCMPWSGPVDLMIRTGGERRISNFILWQAAYAELWFSDVLWPDFKAEDFQEALDWFEGRERRFGMTSAQVRG